MLRKDKIISIKIQYDKYNITFKDSLLLIPLSLNKLSKNFYEVAIFCPPVYATVNLKL